ncbi:MAG: hypothetical protein AABY33_10180 [Pseudomonadota bacterium]
MSVFEVLEYVTADGKKPFGEWLLKLKDKKTGNKIILLLAGSTKKDQQNAIDKAKQYLLDYEERTKL